ncbi:alpha/beta-hydrolase [Auriscalpium vulgare]|uniref:Alpha/beta-hydrolase n=1 Tax=Auriscalpium vulgare TaxID=40419 RepID=A0ACB8R9C3_9AGAM|nr:alpha/beta-hydrolase [Auriscalpium vulgare]
MDHFLDLPYVPAAHSRDRFHEFDIFIAPHQSRKEPGLPPLICFVHGGAWRSEDKGDHSDLARRLAAHTGAPVAVPNYRLTTAANRLQHPAHAEDLLAFLHFMLDWAGPPGASAPLYDPRQVYLVGQSCGAHMIASVLLDSAAPSLAPAPALLRAVQGVALSEQISDVDALLESFPDYRQWFIANTFGDLPSYADVNTAKMPRREGGLHTRWLIIHSTGDSLVDVRQSRLMYDHLRDAGDGGLAGGAVEKNWDELDGEHNEILSSEKYARIVADFIHSKPTFS